MNEPQLTQLFYLLAESKHKKHDVFYSNKQESVKINRLECILGEPDSPALKVFLSNKEMVRFPTNGVAFVHPEIGLQIHKIK